MPALRPGVGDDPRFEPAVTTPAQREPAEETEAEAPIRRRAASPSSAATALKSPLRRRPGVYLGAVLALQSLFLWTQAAALKGSYPASERITDGHTLIGHLVHGHAMPSVVGRMPGTPLLAPALYASVDSLLGSFGVAALVTTLLAGATWAASSTTSRFAGPVAGLLAATIFASCLPATSAATADVFDPLALCALAWAACCALRFGRGDGRNLLLIGAALLAVADYAAYQTLWWDLLVVLLLVRIRPDTEIWNHGPGWMAQRFALVSAVILVICLLAGRDPYFRAITAGIAPNGTLPLALLGWFAAVGLAVYARGRDETELPARAAAPVLPSRRRGGTRAASRHR